MKKQHQHIHWKVDTIDPYVINLSKGFAPIVSTPVVELEWKSFIFRGGEPHFQITTPVKYPSKLTITQRYNTINDLFDIVLAVDAARRIGLTSIDLVLPYFPAARQDRVCNIGEPLTLKVFANIINGCNFDNVFIICPHSEVTPALLDKGKILEEFRCVERAVNMFKDGHNFNIVCPDAGAGKRVEKIVQQLSNNNGFVNFHLIRCEKIRDVKDGSLKEFFVQANDLNGYPSMIVDDIVCGGGTFKGLGEVLRARNCGPLSLFVTHADDVVGIQSMIEYFDQVFVTNSKKNWNEFKYTLDDKLTVFNIEL